MNTAPTVPVGTTTLVGYGGTVVGLITSLLVLIFPEGDDQTIALIASSLFTIGSFLVTQIGRYVQAKELSKRPRIVTVPSAPVSTGTTTRSAFMAGLDTGMATAKIREESGVDPEADLADGDITDEEEFSAPPPDESNMPVQPSQAGFTNGEDEA